MRTTWNSVLFGLVILLTSSFGGARALASETQGIPGERLDPATLGPSIVESWDDALARDRDRTPPEPKGRNGAQGVWVVPSRGGTFFPHSGTHNVTNKWGDTRMGIGFRRVVDVYGAYFAGQAGPGVWTTGVRAVGYRDGQVVAETDWFRQLGSTPRWFAMDLRGVDRLELLSQPVVAGGGWYAMDDLTFSGHSDSLVAADKITVIDFEDVRYNTALTGTDYAGLVWETGTGDFSAPCVPRALPAPQVAPGAQEAEPGGVPERGEPGRAGTLPSLRMDFRGVTMIDSLPPDSMGAIGPTTYAEVVNSVIEVYDRSTGGLISSMSLAAFFPGAGSLIGDPRVLFDPVSQRWFVTATDFYQNAKIYLAVSRTSNPSTFWFKTSILTAQGSDAGKYPDYPTLGVDDNGVYIAAFMIGGTNKMTIWALDKAPLIASTPSLGTVTVWRLLSWEYAIQPAHTFGTPTGEFLVSRYSSAAFRLRRINPPLTAPTLVEVGTVAIASHSNPPLAPALGSDTAIDTLDARPLMAVYRSGSLWTAHTISYNGRAACRWYELDPVARTVKQYGTVSDTSLHYYYPSLMVNKRGEVAMGFSGSNASQYVATYYTGRLASDAAGEMAAPVLFKAGQAPYNNLDGTGRNRWGDYSYTTLDPVDQLTLWTIQEYAALPSGGIDRWGTWIAKLDYLVLGDMNCDRIVNFADINPFVLALSGQAAYEAAYPDCNWYNADCSGDGTVSFADINPFVALLGGL